MTRSKGGGLGIMMLTTTQFDQSTAVEMVATSGGGGSTARGKEERVPQWSQQETRDFIEIRGELERDFTVSKRNKVLWEVVASKMKERGYRRSPDQCKCKWKNLVNRYKGKETSDPENGKPCPFFDELHAMFTESANSTQRVLLETEVSSPNYSKKRLKKSHGDKSSDEFSDNIEDEDEDSDDEQKLTMSKRKKVDKVHHQRVSGKSKQAVNISIHELLEDFYQHQQRAEARLLDAMERMARARQIFEQDWRQLVERMKRERLMLEQDWQEREEQRRIREESRAMKRDALLNTLLNKLIQDDLR